MKKRIYYIDIAKGLGIILVVMGHSIAPFRSLIYLFHMPLFYFLSGYFYKDEYSKNPLLFLKKRLKKLYVPFIKYEFIFLCLHNLFIDMNLYTSGSKYYNLKEFFKNTINILTFQNTEQLLGPFWFFTTLFTVEILSVFISFVISKNIIKKKEILRFSLVLACSRLGYFFSLKSIHLPMNFDISLSILVFYYLGYLYKQHEEKIKYDIRFFISSIIILLLFNCLGKIELSGNYYENPLYLIICSLSGIYFIFYISKFLNRSKLNTTLIRSLGQNTIPIIALHLLSFKLVSLIQIIIYNYPLEQLSNFPTIDSGHWWILYSIFGVFIPYLFDKTLKKSLNIFPFIPKKNAICLMKRDIKR